MVEEIRRYFGEFGMLKNIALAAAAASLATAPVSAQQAVSQDSAPAESESTLGGSQNLLFFVGIAIVAASILLLSENDDPVSA